MLGLYGAPTGLAQFRYFGSAKIINQTSGRAVGQTLSSLLLPESLFVSKMGLQEMGYDDGSWIELA